MNVVKLMCLMVLANVESNLFDFEKSLKALDETDKFVVDTPRCKIPNFKIKFIDPYDVTCTKRQVMIRKVFDYKVKFYMKEYYENCCYQNFDQWEDEIVHGSMPCLPFENQTEIELKHELITVRCETQNKSGITTNVYKDYYAFVKKKQLPKDQNGGSWNVIILGMDNMSRARIYNYFNETANYFQKNGWMDFRGYHKVGDNTESDFLPLLTGINVKMSTSSISKAWRKLSCSSISGCNNLMIWHKFQKAGYVTAFTEDLLYSETNTHTNGSNYMPAHHNLKTFFEANERRIHSSQCFRQGLQVLTYILDFVRTYRDTKFFGFFWIKSYSSDTDSSPKHLDKLLLKFFRNLHLHVLRNTFVFFIGDHTIKLRDTKYHIEALYHHRLPMFFMWTPIEFRASYQKKLANIKINQWRLISPYDVHMTLWDLLKISNDAEVIKQAPGCPRCKSILSEMSDYRHCSDAGIDDNRCLCHTVIQTSMHDYGGMYSVIRAFEYLQEVVRNIPTERCTNCVQFSFKKLLTIHYYSYSNVTYYIVTFAVNPDHLVYEALVRKYVAHNNIYSYEIDTLESKKPPLFRGYCVKNLKHKPFCLCMTQYGCLSIQ